MPEYVKIDRVGTATLLQLLSPLPPSEAFIIDALSCRRIVSRRELLAALYAHRSDGGPAGGEIALRQYLRRLRRKGYPIVTHIKRGLSLTELV